MKIFRCDCYDQDDGLIVSWHPTERAAIKHARDWGRENDTSDGLVETVIIPEERDELIAWLNLHFNRDNG